MKNYRVLKYDDEQLKILGFNSHFPGIMSKRYCYKYPYGWIEFLFAQGKDHVYFYNLRHFLPCELIDEIGKDNEKLLLKEMKEDLKQLKNLNLIK